MKHTLLNILAFSAITFMCGCTKNSGTVTIEGNVDDAKGEKIALMHLSGNNPVLVDTLRLGENGAFKFQPKVEKGGPDFFCLMLNNQIITVISDSLQHPVKLHAEKEKFATSYTVEDSLNNAFKQAIGLGANFRRSVIDLTNDRSAGKLPQAIYADSLNKVIDTYKQQMLSDYIYADPASPISYYLLFETVAGMMIFDPLDAKDSRAFGAVANLWNTVYPNSPRTDFLTKRAYEGQAVRRQMRLDKERADSLMQNTQLAEASYLDLALIDKTDHITTLSSINGKGNVVLLDFTAYYSDLSVAHNMALQKVYDKYHERGLEIYQVCLDFDENFWKVSANNVPWIVVRDREVLYDDQARVQYSAAASLYNVQQLPTVFVMGRDGGVVSKIEGDSDLESAANKVL